PSRRPGPRSRGGSSSRSGARRTSTSGRRSRGPSGQGPEEGHGGGQGLALGFRQGGQAGLQEGVAARADATQPSPAAAGQRHPRGPTVEGIGGTYDEAGSFEVGEDLGQRRRADVLDGGEIAET